MRKRLIPIMLALGLLSACAPSETAVQTSIAETQASYTSTVTDVPSRTSMPTWTPRNTKTVTPTRTSTNTPTETALPATQTIVASTKIAEIKAATATKIASYDEIDTRELVTYSESHVGEFVKVKGRIFNINNTEELQIWVGGGYDAVYVLFKSPFSGIYEDDRITVYGMIAGENCGTNSMGSEICQPLIIGDFYTKP